MRAITQSSALKAINPILGILMVNQLVTGLFAHTLSADLFEIVHKGGGITLAFLATLHLALNWRWVKLTYFNRRQRH